MKTFTVTFTEEIRAKTEEDAYDCLLTYLSECVKYKDVTTFNFSENEESEEVEE